jgi:hypothetical protein
MRGNQLTKYETTCLRDIANCSRLPARRFDHSVLSRLRKYGLIRTMGKFFAEITEAGQDYLLANPETK